MKVKIKKLHPDAVLPKFGKPGDAGADLTAVSVDYDGYTGNMVYKTGIAIEIPEGYVGLIFPRSSIYKTPLRLSNSVGVIDSGYRGEIEFKFTNTFPTSANHQIITYLPGDRIGQLIIIPYPSIDYEWSEDLSESVRGIGGFGSTGLK